MLLLKTLAFFLCLIHHKKSDKGEMFLLVSPTQSGWRLLVLLGDGSKVLVDLRLIQGLELGVVLGHNSHLDLTGFEVCREDGGQAVDGDLQEIRQRWQNIDVVHSR